MKMMFPIVKIQDIFTNEEKKMLEIYRFIYFFVLSRRSLPTMIGCKKKKFVIKALDDHDSLSLEYLLT